MGNCVREPYKNHLYEISLNLDHWFMPLLQIFDVEKMSFNAIRENKVLAKNSGFKV